MKKKILVVWGTTRGNVEQWRERRNYVEGYLRSIAGPDTVVDVSMTKPRPDYTIPWVLGYVDEALATVEILRSIEMNQENYDGMIINDFSDTGINAARELADIPVIGIAESSYYMACLLSHRFSIMTSNEKVSPEKDDYIRALGIESRVASIKPTGTRAKELGDKKKAVIEIGNETVKNSWAEAIILGGGAWAGLGREIQTEVSYPVIEPTATALKMMEVILDLGLKVSKVRKWSKPLTERYGQKYLRQIKQDENKE
jgi:allantoin racemase